MANINYLGLLKKSWSDFRNNLIVVIPILLSIALTIVFLILLGIEFLIFFAIFSKAIISNPKIILNFLGIFLAIVFTILNFIVLVLIGSYIRSMQIGMYKDIVLYKRTSINNMFNYGKMYLKRYFKVNIIKLILFFVPLVVLGGTSALVFLNSRAIGIVLIVLSAIILFVYLVYLMFSLFFLEPIFVTENKAALDIVKLSFNYTKNNFIHVFSTWAISLLTVVVFSMAIYIIMLPFMGIRFMDSVIQSIVFVFLQFILKIIQNIVSIILRLVLDLFVFNSYFSKNKLKT